MYEIPEQADVRSWVSCDLITLTLTPNHLVERRLRPGGGHRLLVGRGDDVGDGDEPADRALERVGLVGDGQLSRPCEALMVSVPQIRTARAQRGR